MVVRQISTGGTSAGIILNEFLQNSDVPYSNPLTLNDLSCPLYDLPPSYASIEPELKKVPQNISLNSIETKINSKKLIF